MKQWNSKRSGGFGAGMVRHALLPAGLVLAACSSDPVELGDGRLGIDRNALESYAAVWEGYVEAYEFGSGSDRIRLVLDEQGNGAVSFGSGTPLPAPTDPDAPFPFADYADGVSGIRFVPTPIEGFEYPIGGALVEDERLRAASFGSEAFEAACAIQTPVAVAGRIEPGAVNGAGGTSATLPTGPIGGPEFACLPELGFGEGPPGTCTTGQSGQPVSCDKAVLCGNYCECTSTSCAARRENELRLDATLNDTGDRLEGTLLGMSDDDRVTVRLTRVAAP